MASLMATLGLNIAPLVAKANEAKAHMDKTGKSIAGDIGSKFGGMLSGQLAGIVSAGAISAAMHNVIEYGGKVNDLSLRLGISTQAVQEWDYALQQNGSSIEAAAGFFQKLGINREKALAGSDEEIAAFKKLGISIDDLKGKRIEDIGLQISKAFEVGDPQTLIGPLVKVGGKAAGDLAAAFRDGLGDLIDDFRNSKLGIPPETAESFDRAGDAFGKFKVQFRDGVIAPLTGLFLDAIRGANEAMDYFVALMMGPVLGSIEGFKNFDFSSPFKSIKATFSSVESETTNQLQRIAEKKKAQEDADEKRRARLANKGKGGIGDGTDAKETEKEAKELAHINEQIAAEERRGRLAAMTDEQKIKALRAEVALLKQKEDAETKIDEKAKLKLERTKVGNELESDERQLKEKHDKLSDKAKLDEEKYNHKKPATVNSLQQMGGFLGSYSKAPETASLDVQRKSEEHLSRIGKLSEEMRNLLRTLNYGATKTNSAEY